MNRLALNFICKDESHCVLDMLHSVRPITDLIVAVDTGSSDNTISLIHDFGKEFGIPVFVHERPFDNFGNSRNHALVRLWEAVDELNWPRDATYGFWIDCDERMEIDPVFDKHALTAGLYVVRTTENQLTYSKSLLFKLSYNFWWEGPIHEILRWEDPSMPSATVSGILIHYQRIGASWKKNLVDKFLYYATELEKFVADGHHQYRWIFNVAESYSAAAQECDDHDREVTIRKKALHYYRLAEEIGDRATEDKFLLQLRIAEAIQSIDPADLEAEHHYLMAYEWKPDRAESFKRLINGLFSKKDWHRAYLYSWFAQLQFHGADPYAGNNHILIEESLYKWRMLYLYYIACFLSGRKKKARTAYRRLKEIFRDNRAKVSDAERFLMLANSPVLMKLRGLLQVMKGVFQNSKPAYHYE